MRSIKFRAWDKSEKVMTQSGIKYNKVQCELVCGDNQILMQFTGLLDKNGVEIYEGDIVNSTLFGICQVVYFKNAFITQSDDGSYSRSSKYLHGDNCEVIGNIYENPELLEVKDA
jgi:uncharacterized phage protein (TIGR01671 family)